MLGVIVMLFNSLIKNSGVTTTKLDARLLGIICVVLSVLGTVISLFVSHDYWSLNSDSPHSEYNQATTTTPRILSIIIAFCIRITSTVF